MTDLKQPAEQVVTFYNRGGTAEQWIKEGKTAIKWTRLSCQRFRANEVRLQLHALAYNLTNFLRTLALPQAMANWSLTTLREKLARIGARMVRHGHYITFQMAEVAVSGRMFGRILVRIAQLRASPRPAWLGRRSVGRGKPRRTYALIKANTAFNIDDSPSAPASSASGAPTHHLLHQNCSGGPEWIP